jgi:hypothetical protein
MTKALVVTLIAVMLVGRTAAAEEEREPWKPVFVASLALTVGAGAFWGFSHLSMRSEADEIMAVNAKGSTITQDDCNARAGITGDTGDHFDSACTWRSRSRTASVLVIGFGIVTLATAYLAFVHGDEPAANRSSVSIAPTISREGAGAALSLRW